MRLQIEELGKTGNVRRGAPKAIRIRVTNPEPDLVARNVTVWATTAARRLAPPPSGAATLIPRLTPGQHRDLAFDAPQELGLLFVRADTEEWIPKDDEDAP